MTEKNKDLVKRKLDGGDNLYSKADLERALLFLVDREISRVRRGGYSMELEDSLIEHFERHVLMALVGLAGPTEKIL